MTAGTARTARRPRTWVISGWAGTARPTTAWSPSPRCGPMSGCTIRCMRCRTRRPGTSRKGRTIRRSAPSWQIGADLAVRARAAGFVFRAVAADSAYGDQDGFRGELAEAGLPFVMALKPRHGTWAYGADAYTPVDAARALAWNGPADPGDWRPVTRTFRDGHAETLVRRRRDPGLVGAGRLHPPGGGHRRPGAPCRTRPPGTWPQLARPGGPREAASAHPPADLAEVTGSTASGTGSSKATSRSKTSWAGPTSRSAPTPRSAATRPWSTARSASAGTPGSRSSRTRARRRHRGRHPAAERGGPRAALPPPAPSWPRALRAIRAWLSPWIALQRWWQAWSNSAPAPAAASPDGLGRGRLRPAPLHPELTNYR